jgi:hypothetical protein
MDALLGYDSADQVLGRAAHELLVQDRGFAGCQTTERAKILRPVDETTQPVREFGGRASIGMATRLLGVTSWNT